MAAVLCVFEHVLAQIRKELPHLSALYTRSDNAGCYAGASVIMAQSALCSRAGIFLKRTDFSEPQRGKDQADRDSAVAKSCLRAYTNRGGNIKSAISIKEALDGSLGCLSGSKTSVIAIDERKCVLPKTKIPEITKYHSVEFADSLATFWQYFNIACISPKSTQPCPRLTQFTLLENGIGFVIDNIKSILSSMPSLVKLTLSILDTPDLIFTDGQTFESILNEYLPHLRQFDYTMTYRIDDQTLIEDFHQWSMNFVYYKNEYIFIHYYGHQIKMINEDYLLLKTNLIHQFDQILKELNI
ncbi:unnamed protein product [Rotaria sp. Silwood2]|nr:unnamed protein product [Rotaria sp. Silwood2]CAF3981247.1 unnamed protein product [Rotaria sp. Silwood2]